VTREQLEHAIRAACEIARDTEVLVFGSQAILGEHPHAPPALRASIEVDMQPVHAPEAVDAIDGALGELSQFHATHGFYVHGVSIDSAVLPSGWRDRTVPVSDPYWTRGHVGHCVEAHDLAASKLVAHRPKDLDFVRTLLTERLVDAGLLLERIACLPIEKPLRDRIGDWLRGTVREL
jgi:hypothetical protein